MPGATQSAHRKVTHIMRALERDVFDAVWAAIEPLLPPPPRTHPLGCHRPRISDRICFRGILSALCWDPSIATSLITTATYKLIRITALDASPT